MQPQNLAWTALALCACTQTGEVLTKQQRDEHHVVTPEADAAVSPVDAGGAPIATASQAPPETPSAPPLPSRPDAAPTVDETSDPKPLLLEAPPLTVGMGHNATCVVVNLDFRGIWCVGETEIASLEDSGADAARGLFVSATGGEHHMCVQDVLGDVYCWGDNSKGQLGDSQVDYAARPRRVRVPRPVLQLSSGGSHVCAITDDGQLYCWGDNTDGQLGIGGTSDEDDSRDFARRDVTAVDEGPWISIAAGDAHTCGVKSDGTLACWGRNSERQSGDHAEAVLRTPTLVNTEHSWKQAVAGQSHSCGLRTDGTLWCWGRNTTQDSGYPLGTELESELAAPTRIGDDRWRSISTGGFHTCGTTEGGEAWCWGRNDAGQLGTGDTELRRLPTFVRNEVSVAAAGRSHSCIVTATHDDVLCTGSNEFGQLALLSDEHRSTFTSLSEELQRRFLNSRSDR